VPYLRFSRDKRGYENTYVLHGGGTGGKLRPRMLYWFRTPPNVKVGRLPLDAEAIRAVEVHNPDVTFDWNKMLKMRAMPAIRPGTAAGRVARKRTRRPPAIESTVPRTNLAQETETAQTSANTNAVAAPEEQLTDPQLLEAEAHLVSGDEREEPEATADALGEHPVVTLIGHETLARIRARYAEIQARISEKSLGPDELDVIRSSAEALNPDRWTTIESAMTRIERFEADVEAIKAKLGRRPARARRTQR